MQSAIERGNFPSLAKDFYNPEYSGQVIGEAGERSLLNLAVLRVIGAEEILAEINDTRGINGTLKWSPEDCEMHIGKTLTTESLLQNINTVSLFWQGRPKTASAPEQSYRLSIAVRSAKQIGCFLLVGENGSYPSDGEVSEQFSFLPDELAPYIDSAYAAISDDVFPLITRKKLLVNPTIVDKLREHIKDELTGSVDFLESGGLLGRL